LFALFYLTHVRRRIITFYFYRQCSTCQTLDSVFRGESKKVEIAIRDMNVWALWWAVGKSIGLHVHTYVDPSILPIQRPRTRQRTFLISGKRELHLRWHRPQSLTVHWLECLPTRLHNLRLLHDPDKI